VVANPDVVRTIPEGLSDEEAVFFTFAEICMNGVRRGKVCWGEAVAVYGLGLLGQLTARFCHLAGARPVLGVDVFESRINLLPQMPGLNGINPNKADIVSEVKKLTDGRMTDTVIEVTGNPNIITEELKILRDLGKLVILSSPCGPTSSFDFNDFCTEHNFEIIGSHFSDPPVATPYNQWTRKRHSELFFDLIASGEIDLKPLISHRISYAEAPDLYRSILKDRSGTMGIIIDWE
jgi:threonine dehydrogenase-like Zn-dependent dehydrogenase